MFLHEDPGLFRDIIEAASASQNNRPISIIEKDYYVTMILKLLSEEAPGCVFKGGTSLSKCHHANSHFFDPPHPGNLFKTLRHCRFQSISNDVK